METLKTKLCLGIGGANARGASPVVGGVRGTSSVGVRRSPAADADIRVPIIMKGKRAAVIGDEPIGIVISRGADREKPPVFSAYVWAPAPEKKPDEPAETRVA